MHDTQLAMSRFITAQVIDWAHYSPQPVDHALRLIGKGGEAPRDPLPVLPFGCANGRQAVIWLLRDLRVTALDAEQAAAYLSISCLESGEYIAEFWDTYAGVKTGDQSFTTCECGREARLALPAFKRDLAIAIKPFSQPQSA